MIYTNDFYVPVIIIFESDLSELPMNYMCKWSYIFMQLFISAYDFILE